MSKRLLVVTALAGVLAGCSMVPDYKRPAAPVPVAWPSLDQKVGAGGTAAPSGDWRAWFADPALQALIGQALEHNRDLRIAVGRVAEARALAGLAAADRLPNVDLGAQRAASLTPGDLSSTGRPLNAQRYDVNLAVAAFELDFWGRVKALDAAAQANYLASENARRAFALSLVGDVANAWLALLELNERLVLTEATLKSREETRMLIGKRRDVGLAGDLDALAADGAYQTARAEAANLARQKAAAENALRLLVGSPDALALAGGSLDRPGIVADLAVGLPSEVLLDRPDVRAAEERLKAANANIGAARAAFLPRILLTATAGTASRALAGLFAGGSRAWAFTPTLRQPLFDAGRNEANVDLAVARKTIAVADYEKTIQLAFRDVADLLSAREPLAEQLAAAEANATAQAQRLALADARYTAGVSSHLELLDAQRESFAARQSALAARRAWLANAAGFYKALGGGGPARR